jgi:hypothetical protein
VKKSSKVAYYEGIKHYDHLGFCFSSLLGLRRVSPLSTSKQGSKRRTRWTDAEKVNRATDVQLQLPPRRYVRTYVRGSPITAEGLAQGCPLSPFLASAQRPPHRPNAKLCNRAKARLEDQSYPGDDNLGLLAQTKTYIDDTNLLVLPFRDIYHGSSLLLQNLERPSEFTSTTTKQKY